MKTKEDFLDLAIGIGVIPALYRHKRQKYLIVQAFLADAGFRTAYVLRNGKALKMSSEDFHEDYDLLPTRPLYASATIDTQAR